MKLFLYLLSIITALASCTPAAEQAAMDAGSYDERFGRSTLTRGTLFEPTEMAVLPNLDIVVIQRRGEIMLYKQKTSEVKQIGFLDVYHASSGIPNPGEEEEGLLGVAADPSFERNHYLYLFYCPADTSVNRLSRFTMVNDTIEHTSEKIILQFYSQRNICCHTGGSIAFGKDRLLYLSTGDNTTPFDVPGKVFVNSGYAPLDNRGGLEAYDASRSAANSNDLRGKILRIRLNKDGTYKIPQGNLFSEHTPRTRPEIYVMGNRNPYRISVDQKSGYLYWGDVGPDAPADSSERGPRGYDEINQARSAGFFGWPFFVGNNFAYTSFNYKTGVSGTIFNPLDPVNHSINNTGLKHLPEAQPAFIWYAFDSSRQFPTVGTGGRTAMAGPVYHGGSFYPNKTRYPDSFDGKLFIYDWVRGWINLVTMHQNGDYAGMEPFMTGTRFAAPIDMELGPDGRLYILEYGKGWYTKNPDAAITRIDFSKYQRIAGNKPSGRKEMGKHDDEKAAQQLISRLDCKTCHHVNEVSIGPSFVQVSAYYKGRDNAVSLIADKIRYGGSGNWGRMAMPAHNSMKKNDIKTIAAWIISLSANKDTVPSMKK